jgi:iron-sulfur cluster insertion protein
MLKVPMDDAALTLSEKAADRVKYLRQKRGRDDLMLRVMVDSGGCSGFQYRIDFTDVITGDDKIFSSHGVAVVTDTVSLDYLGGAEVDYSESLIGASFTIKNPKASSGCGCGASFSV